MPMRTSIWVSRMGLAIVAARDKSRSRAASARGGAIHHHHSPHVVAAVSTGAFEGVRSGAHERRKKIVGRRDHEQSAANKGQRGRWGCREGCRQRSFRCLSAAAPPRDFGLRWRPTVSQGWFTVWKNNLVSRVVPGCFGEVWWRKRRSMKKIPKKDLFNRVNCNRS